MTTVGSIIVAGRKKAGKTQLEIADKIGISRSYLAAVETGKYNPSVRVLVLLAKELGVDLNFLTK